MSNKFWVYTILLLLLTVSCDRRPLEVYNENVADLQIKVDWSQFDEHPSGMTMLFSKDGDDVTQTVVTNEVDSVDVFLTPGIYYMTLFNQSFDEFGSMYFSDTRSHDQVKARATDLTTVLTEWSASGRYMSDPDPIAVAVDTIIITEDMVGRRYVFEDYQVHNVEVDTIRHIICEVPKPMTTMLSVDVRVKGINSLRAVEGSIDGMADGFLLSQFWRTETTGTLLLSQWKAMFDYEDNGMGWLTIRIPTFGLPHGKEMEWQRAETDNVLRLHFMLIDGSTLDFTYPVGKFIKYRGEIEDMIARTDQTLELLLVIDADTDGKGNFPYPELPDVENDGNGGTFEAFVDDWEEGGDISIPL